MAQQTGQSHRPDRSRAPMDIALDSSKGFRERSKSVMPACSSFRSVFRCDQIVSILQILMRLVRIGC